MYVGNQVSLEESKVKLIAVKQNGIWAALEPNADENLWFNKSKDSGRYEFFVVTSEGTMYKAALDWVKHVAAEADYNAIWNGDKSTWYIKVTVPGESLDDRSVESISLIKEAGADLETPKALMPDSDAVLWFGVAGADGLVDDKAAGEYAFKVVRNDGTEYIFSFVYEPDKVNDVEKVVFYGGKGTENDPYLIKTYAHLKALEKLPVGIMSN